MISSSGLIGPGIARLHRCSPHLDSTFIRRARELGFTLDEVRALLALSEHDGRAACVEVRQLAADHLTKVKAKIADLRAMGRVLGDAVRRCDAGELPGCPLIDSLFHKSERPRPLEKSVSRPQCTSPREGEDEPSAAML